MVSNLCFSKVHFPKKVCSLFLLFFLLTHTISNSYAHTRDSLSSKKIEFIENKNQWESNILFRANLNSGAFFAEQNCLTYLVLNEKQLADFFAAKRNPNAGVKKNNSGLIDAAAYKVHFVNANKEVRVAGSQPKYDYHNYYLGDHPNKWAANVKKYNLIQYEELYPGINLVFRQDAHHLKYEFIVNEGYSPDIITLHYEGVKNLSVSKENLIITTEVSQIIELKPFAYQISDHGDTLPVKCRYKLNKQHLSFELESYDKTRKLVIDPVLIFSSYSGSTADNWGYTATYDNHGNLYAGGNAFNLGYPTTTGAFQVNYAGGTVDIAISKFSADGSTLLFSTYLGGDRTEVPHSLVVNDNDELYVLGSTSSSNFPTTAGAYQTSFAGGTFYSLTSLQYLNGSDIIVSKFNSTGSQLLGSTYIGGAGNDGLNTMAELKKNYADEARGEIILDKHSNVYIVSSTQSNNFPTTPGVFQPTFRGGGQDGCIIKFNHNLTNLIWSSYLGGSGYDAAYSIVLASDNSIYVCGGTNSPDLPVTQGVVKPTFGGGTADGFIAHVNENGSHILHATYLGTSEYDQTYLIKNDRNDNPHVFGQTGATGSSWIQNAGWYVLSGGQFLTKLNPTLSSITWSTAFGSGNGGPDISPTALLVDVCNNIYMSGWGGYFINGFGGTYNLPTTADAFQLTTDGADYYFICLKDDASSLVFASFFGSPHTHEHVDGGTSRFDRKGRIYQAVCAGCGGWDDFPTTPGAWSQDNGSSNCNIGVIKFDFNLPAVIADFTIPNTVCAPINLHFNNTSQSISASTSYHWDFGDGTTSTLQSPYHLYTASGVYTIRLIVQDLSSCNFADTTYRQLVVLSNSSDTLATLSICHGSFTQIGIPPSGNQYITYSWTPTTYLSNPSISNPISTPLSTTQYRLVISDGICVDTLRQKVIVENLEVDAGNHITICKGDTVTLTPTVSVTGSGNRYYWSTNRQFSSIINPNITQADLRVSPPTGTTYYLKVTTALCEVIDSLTVSVSEVSITAVENPYISCYKDTIQISVTAGSTEPYTYTWTPTQSIISGGNTNSPWVSPPGNTTFTVTATNQLGCSQTTDIQVNIKKLEAHAQIVNTTCFAGSTGSISVAPTGGDAPYTYSWSTGHSNSSISHLHAGNYYLTITDINGCKTLDTFTITQPSPIVLQYVSSQNVFCDGICNGRINVIASGGTGALSYQWINGQTGQQAVNLCAGVYSVTATDANGCTATQSFSVTDTSSFIVNFGLDSITCFNDCDGSAFVSLISGLPPYNITWYDGSHANTLYNLCSGIYFAEVTESSGCKHHVYIQIPNPQPLVFDEIVLNSPSCYGSSNGSVCFYVTGGTPPYRYFIDDVPCNDNIFNLSAGTFKLTVIDYHGCITDTLITLPQPVPLSATENHSSPPCPEVCNAWLSLSASGGTPPYQYHWNNGYTSNYGENLCSGTYTVTISDILSCSFVRQVTIADSSTFPTAILAWSDEDTVYRGASATLHATHIPGFTYQWLPAAGVVNPTGSSTPAIVSKTTVYTVLVKDVYGCIKKDTVLVTTKDAICREPYIFVPNAFSPNNDQLNDVLYVRGEVLSSINFKIYDRWGEVVFETNDLAHGWDGTFRGKPCDPGVYDYHLEAVCFGLERFIKKGNITLLR